jgi:hypothetical protein
MFSLLLATTVGYYSWLNRADRAEMPSSEQPSSSAEEEYSHDNLVRAAGPASSSESSSADASRLTRTHGCFAIDGLPRAEPEEGHRDRHYASRELNFEEGPALTSSALLSAAERRAYDRDGVVVCSQPLLSRAEAAHHAALWEACWREEAVGGADAPGDAVNGYFKKYRGCHELVSHPRVVQLARDVLGPNVCCWGGHYIAKLPHTDVPTQVHQDAWYWAFTPARQVTVWVALDDVDEANGAVRFFHGSHRLGLQHREAGEEGQLYPRLAAACGEAVPAPLPAGHATAHSDMCAHVSASSNLSNRRRLGIAITYTRMDGGVHDGGLGWSTGVFIPEGSTAPTQDWVELDPSTMPYGPPGFEPPPTKADAAEVSAPRL